MKLKELNTHERDSKIEFDEKPHEYYIDGSKEGIISVTTFIHNFFPKFDADKIIDKMMNSSNWENSKYFGMTKEEIIQDWEDNKNYAANKGTMMHRDIELFYNDIEIENDSEEFNYFLDFHNEHTNLKPFRSEWEIFCEELKLAGSIDMCFDDDGEIVIYDWKRSKDIKEVNAWENGFYPLTHIPHANYWHYSLQLNIYKALLEKHYGVKVKEMYLLWLHPNNDSYKKLKVSHLPDEVELLFKERLNQIK
jgi:ATP-dependent exoDNAse (exonuclease V) beta subunit